MATRGFLPIAMAVLALRVAQPVPDFSGTWVFDKDKSDPPIVGVGDQQGPFGPGALFTDAPESPVIITQTATELVLQGRGGGKVVYKLDGTETRNAGPRGDMTSSSKWQKSTLVTRFRQTVTTARGRMTIDLTERRSLRANGRTMVLELSRNTPRGTRARKLVFDRQR